MLTDCELYCVDVIKGKRRGIGSFFARILLRTLSWAYRTAVFFRNWAFDNGLLRRYSPPVPVVISVGNIVAGGTGKTPVTLMLGKQLSDYAVAIVTRGYRSPAEQLATPLVLSKGEGPQYPSSFCGDEPYLLAQNLPNAHVYVGRKRSLASRMAAKAGAQVILLDDGMQYRYLSRDLEVVVIDGSDPFGKGYFLPRGFLRENKNALARASLVIANHVSDRVKYLSCKHKLAHYTSAPLVAVHPVIASVHDLEGKTIKLAEGTRVGLFCGIANPDHFRELVEREGWQVVAEHVSADHVAPDPALLNQFGEQCVQKGAQYLLCTEKDRVRITEPLVCPLPIGWVKMHLAILEGQMQWNAFIEKIKIKLDADTALRADGDR
jgi:tetraacyldisaccharide 4'-kinase